MGPYDAPAGTIGPRGMDLGPYFQQWQLQQQAQQQAQRQAQQQQQFVREMAFRETAQKASRELADLELRDRQAGREQQAGLAKSELALKERKVTDAEQARKVDLQRKDEALAKSEKQQQTAARAMTEAENAGAAMLADGMSADEARARMVKAAATLPPEEQGVSIAAINEWYKGATGRTELQRKRTRDDVKAERDDKMFASWEATEEDKAAATNAEATIESTIAQMEAGGADPIRAKAALTDLIGKMTDPAAKLAGLAALGRWEEKQFQAKARDLDLQVKQGQLDAQARAAQDSEDKKAAYDAELGKINAALQGPEFADILADFNDDPEHALRRENLERVARNPYLAEMLERAAKYAAPSEDELRAKRNTKALQDKQLREQGIDPETGEPMTPEQKTESGGAALAGLTEAEQSDYVGLARRVEAGQYESGTGGGVLELKKKAYDLLQDLADKNDKDAQERKKIARKLIADADKVGDKSFSAIQAYLPETPAEIAAESDPFDRLLGAAGYLGID